MTSFSAQLKRPVINMPHCIQAQCGLGSSSLNTSGWGPVQSSWLTLASVAEVRSFPAAQPAQVSLTGALSPWEASGCCGTHRTPAQHQLGPLAPVLDLGCALCVPGPVRTPELHEASQKPSSCLESPKPRVSGDSKWNSSLPCSQSYRLRILLS